MTPNNTSALWVLLFCAQSLYAQTGTRPDTTELTLLGLDREADSAEVERALGRPESVRWYEHPNDVGARYQRLYYRNAVVFMGPDGLKLGVMLVAQGVSTRRGLSVGDPVERALDLYGAPDSRTRTELRWHIAAPNKPLLVVEVSNGRVASIFAGHVIDKLRPLPNSGFEATHVKRASALQAFQPRAPQPGRYMGSEQELL